MENKKAAHAPEPMAGSGNAKQTGGNGDGMSDVCTNEPTDHL